MPHKFMHIRWTPKTTADIIDMIHKHSLLHGIGVETAKHHNADAAPVFQCLEFKTDQMICELQASMNHVFLFHDCGSITILPPAEFEKLRDSKQEAFIS